MLDEHRHRLLVFRKLRCHEHTRGHWHLYLQKFAHNNRENEASTNDFLLQILLVVFDCFRHQ